MTGLDTSTVHTLAPALMVAADLPSTIDKPSASKLHSSNAMFFEQPVYQILVAEDWAAAVKSCPASAV